MSDNDIEAELQPESCGALHTPSSILDEPASGLDGPASGEPSSGLDEPASGGRGPASEPQEPQEGASV
ncbi:hypothetical protein T484DRAFT_1832445 [Baffinella frigidus]|nr:hypothetical protein T484DRAFT_1832445 [Cryptophyta sp. CCMP2293]